MTLLEVIRAYKSNKRRTVAGFIRHLKKHTSGQYTDSFLKRKAIKYLNHWKKYKNTY